MALNDRFCGFDEVRYSVAKGGYYCSCCGKRLHKDFREVVRQTLPDEFVKRLDKQCEAE